MGRASEIHHIAIQSDEAKTAFEAAFRSAGLKTQKDQKKYTRSQVKPNFF